MDGPSPARLYATLLGAILLVVGIGGFFYSASFGQPGKVDDLLGVLPVNGWENALHIASGAIGLAVAGFAARQYALVLGVFYTAIAIWGFATGGGASIIGLLPVGLGGSLIHLILGLLGLSAALATPARGLKARTKPAG
jgi:hypothetical protein